MTNQRRLNAEWQALRELCIPTATPKQLDDLKRVFYAGAFTLYRMVMQESSNEDNAVKLLQGVRDEIRTFFMEEWPTNGISKQ